MPTRRVTAGDLELTICEEGAGGRPFLLLHGFTGAKEDFSLPMAVDGRGPSVLERLAEAGWHAVAPDQRGHGASPKPADESAYSLDTFAGDAVALADALGWERFTLLGHSMGGMIAQAVALAVPERITTLILMDTGHGPLQDVDRSDADAAIALVRSQGIEALADLMAERRGTSPLDSPSSIRLLNERPGWAEEGDRKMRASSPAMYAAMLTEIFEQRDRLDDLASLTMPTLVVVGEEDSPFLGAAERMAAAIAGARHEVVPGAGHSPQFENPAGWWKAVEGFLGEVAS